jgi:hypothetical protein
LPFNPQISQERFHKYSLVCDGVWKLVVVGGSILDVSLEEALKNSDPEAGPTAELFHLGKDPGETTNVAAENPDITTRLWDLLREFRALKLDDIPDYQEGRQDFKAPKDWLIKE